MLGGTVAAQGGPWPDARQLVLVVSADWDAPRGRLHAYQRHAPDAAWQAVGGGAEVVLGRAGSAWGIGLHPRQSGGPHKREGDGRSPAGAFAIGAAFGYADADAVASGLGYRAMTATDWCVDVPGSPLYNRIVDSAAVGEAAVAGATEPMRRDIHADGDQRYRAGFVIDHNPDASAGAGSCIFAHLWDSPDTPTAGCTAMAAPRMQTLLGWLEREAAPVFVLLPESEYRRLREAWRLPAGAAP
ncbi:L,D-transpeptidase family protein [Coralloluteibacterium stylophorae]|nr:hypothetical protein [Coralloluteibacterium stylophorae]